MKPPTPVLDWCIRALWVAVLAGLALLLAGLFQGPEQVVGAWMSPGGELLCMRGASGATRTYRLPDLEEPLVTAQLAGRLEPLAWAPETLLVARLEEGVILLQVDQLQERRWFSPAPPALLLGQRGRVLVAADVGQPRAPLQTFDLERWSAGTVPAPGPEDTGLPFERLLTPATVVPAGVQLALADGRLEIQNPALGAGSRQLWWSRPRIWCYGLLMGLAVLLVLLRAVRVLLRRRRRFDRLIQETLASTEAKGGDGGT